MRKNLSPELQKIWQEGFDSNYETDNPYRNHAVPGPYGITPEYEAFWEGHKDAWKPLEIMLAQTFYENEGGMNLDEYQETTGDPNPKEEWKKLEPWKHDDYLVAAKEAIRMMLKLGIIDTKRMRELCLKLV